MSYEKEKLKRETIYRLDEDIPSRINKLKSGLVKGDFFCEIAFAIKIYDHLGYNMSAGLHRDILSMGLEKTCLNFEETEKAMNRGREKAEFVLLIYEGGRAFINGIIGIKDH